MLWGTRAGGGPTPDICALCSGLIQKEATRRQQRAKGASQPVKSAREEAVQEEEGILQLRQVGTLRGNDL